MLRVTAIFDNKIAAPITPTEFVKRDYLTATGKEDLLHILVEQESEFPIPIHLCGQKPSGGCGTSNGV